MNDEPLNPTDESAPPDWVAPFCHENLDHVVEIVVDSPPEPLAVPEAAGQTS